MGKAGVGKTLACNLIQQENYSPFSLILPWAYDLKRIAREEFGWDGEKDDNGRRLLQILGTECGRMYGGDSFWVDKWWENINDYAAANTPKDPSKHIIILNDDTRFDNEAAKIKVNGTMIKLTGRCHDLGNNASHSSEAGIGPEHIDYVIDNSETIEDLQEQLRKLWPMIVSSANKKL